MSFSKHLRFDCRAPGWREGEGRGGEARGCGPAAAYTETVGGLVGQASWEEPHRWSYVLLRSTDRELLFCTAFKDHCGSVLMCGINQTAHAMREARAEPDIDRPQPLGLSAPISGTEMR